MADGFPRLLWTGLIDGPAELCSGSRDSAGCDQLGKPLHGVSTCPVVFADFAAKA